ncbi:MAG: DUF4091 domain-containing protein, partial [Kiritimatiellae bacterium]|nr:DUF4091 domain-containing protein [Kiritimatiellia bacterium]
EKRTAGNYTYYLSGSSWSTKYMESVPKVLWPHVNNIELKPGETKQIWLTFHVPEKAKPGIYEGTITVRPNNFPQQVLKAKLTVYPIKLSLSDRFEGMYWYEALKFYPQHRKKELIDMAQHGIRAIVLGVTAPELKENNGNLTLDFTKMDTLIQEARDAGLTASFTPFETSGVASKIRGFMKKNSSISKATFDDLYAQAIGEIHKHAKENRWPKVLFYPVDEIGNSPERIEKLKELGALIRKTPDAAIYCTANNFEAGKKCEDFIDYWCANIPMTKEQEQYVLSKGKTYMRYGNAYNFNPRVSRTVSGFGLWRTAAVAMYYWHYQACVGDPFNPLDGSSRDWCASYPSPDGPVNSIDFESIREGIDDLNYIRTLQILIEEAKKKGKADLTKNGEAIIDEIRTIDPTFTQYDLIDVPNEKYHEFRLRMAQEIMKLQEAVK